MKRIVRNNKKWKWMVLLTSVFLIAFMVVYSFRSKDDTLAADWYLQNGDGQRISSDYIMRKYTDRFGLVSEDINSVQNITVRLSDLTTVKITDLQPSATDAATYSGARTTFSVEIANNNVSIGSSVGMDVYAYDGNGNQLYYEHFTINTAFSINEYLNSSAPKAKITKINPENERSAIVLDDGAELPFGKDASMVDERKYLNLLFGNASAQNVSGGAVQQPAEWESSNRDVVVVDDSIGDGRGGIRAAGAGRAMLSVSWYDNGTRYQDSIEVYVRPKIMDQSGEIDIGSDSTDSGEGMRDIETGSIIKVSAKFDYNQNESISDKIVWVIEKQEGEETYLVKDSVGGVTDEFKEEADLIWISSENGYRLRAKAGRYIISFYVKGTYVSYEDTVKREDAWKKEHGCPPVYIKGGVHVPSNYKSVDVFLNVGGKYKLPDAFNITEDIYQECFTYEPVEDESTSEDDESESSTGGSIASGNMYEHITISPDGTIIAIKEGVTKIRIKARQKIESTGLNGEIRTGASVIITIHIRQPFSLNVSIANMAVGEELPLYPFPAFNDFDENEIVWNWESPDDPNGSYVKILDQGDSKTRIRALKPTPTGKTVTITLSRTTPDGITLTASCQITIDITTSGFHIKPSALTMKAGDVQTITTDLKGSYKLAWISSDTNIATVVPSSDMLSAQITARKPGTAIITAVNAANNVYSTCTITVQQEITSLDIGIAGKKYTAYDTTLSEGFVFMEPLYQPKDATDKNFIWDSSDKTVATVDEKGKVTLLKEGSTYITLKAGASSVSPAMCILNIVPVPIKPISSITTDPTELSMVKGDTRTIKATYNPIDVTDPTLIWTSFDEKVAKVDNTGKVTAVGVGATYINIEASLVDSNGNKAKAIVKVTVRDKLTSIEFESKTTYVSIGSSKQLDIIFKPDKDVNKKVTFSSSDDSIFKVTPGKEEGTCIIQGIAAGQAVLSCVSEELGQAGVKTCMVYVTEADVATKDFIITPAAETVYIGQTLQMVKTFTPENATNQNVTWNSSDSGIASVTALGLVRGVKEGKVTVSAVYTDTANKVPIIRTSTIEVKPVPINVTDFDVTPDTQNIKVGEKFSLTPVFTPNNASNKNVDYQSLDEGVVTVSEKGEVIGVGAGDAIIQCQAEDGGFIATCMVHVENAIEFSLSPATREIAVGRSFKLKKVTNPENAKKTAEWSTSNSSIARVDATGKVTGRRIGSCTITCTLTRYNQSARCRVKVAKLKSKVTIDKKNIRLGVGQTYRLKKTVTSNDTSLPKVTWKSANKKVATVSSGGKITGKKEGLTKVTVTTDDSVRAKATCKVRVIQRVSSISLNSDYMVCYVGRSKKLTAKYRPSNATIKKVKWTSGDENIARVTGSGKVRGIAEGNTYITATTTDGSNKRARCFVKVLDEVPVTSIVVAQTNLTLQSGDSRKLTYKVLPEDTSDSLEFASDNERVARVNKKGVVTAVGTGDATITILATSGASSNVDVNVVALNKTEINMRQYDSETLTVFGTTDTVTWYTSNARVATVDNGRIVGRSEGITYVYAYVNGCRLSCRVTITSVNS